MLWGCEGRGMNHKSGFELLSTVHNRPCKRSSAHAVPFSLCEAEGDGSVQHLPSAWGCRC